MSIISFGSRPPVVTLALVAASLLATGAVWAVGAERALPVLLIASPGTVPFAQVRAGEVWRLVTPIFVHFGLLHILFNMMWLWDLGRAIERLKGPGFLLAFVVLVGIAGNVMQYTITGSPLFGGMSGVVYGLLGYIWMRGRYNPAFGIALHRSTVAMMLVWYALCWTGLLGPIANWAHTGGLLMGLAWGFVDRRPARRRSVE